MRKDMFLCMHDQGFEDFSNIQYFFIRFVIEGTESNCHPQQIDVALIRSRANLK